MGSRSPLARGSAASTIASIGLRTCGVGWNSFPDTISASPQRRRLDLAALGDGRLAILPISRYGNFRRTAVTAALWISSFSGLLLADLGVTNPPPIASPGTPVRVNFYVNGTLCGCGAGNFGAAGHGVSHRPVALVDARKGVVLERRLVTSSWRRWHITI